MVSFDPKANLESQCAISLSNTDYHRLHNFHSANTSYVYKPLELDQIYYVNVFAKLRLPGTYEYEYLPYRSITVDPKLQVKISETFSSLMISLGLIIVVLAVLVWYLKNKTEKIE